MLSARFHGSREETLLSPTPQGSFPNEIFPKLSLQGKGVGQGNKAGGRTGKVKWPVGRKTHESEPGTGGNESQGWQHPRWRDRAVGGEAGGEQGPWHWGSSMTVKDDQGHCGGGEGLAWRDMRFGELWKCSGEEGLYFKWETSSSEERELSSRAVNQTLFWKPNFLSQRVLSVADLAYSLQGELISGRGN